MSDLLRAFLRWNANRKNPHMRFAYFPCWVVTWRTTHALVWLQHYYTKDNEGYKRVDRLGIFSIEL